MIIDWFMAPSVPARERKAKELEKTKVFGGIAPKVTDYRCPETLCAKFPYHRELVTQTPGEVVVPIDYGKVLLSRLKSTLGLFVISNTC